MAHLSALEPDQDQTQPVVELRIQATLDQLSILRALAATVAIQENFDLDAIARHQTGPWTKSVRI